MARLTYPEEPRDIWIVAETKDGALTTLTKELVYGARTAADMMGFYVKVALLGSGVSELANELYPVGADRVYVAEDDHLKPCESSGELVRTLSQGCYESWLKVLSD